MSPAPSSGGLVGLGITIALTAISTLFVFLRFWARGLIRFGIWLDDWLALATLAAMYWVLIISIIAVEKTGLGKPTVSVISEDPTAVTLILKLLYSYNFAYLFASPLMKLTVLAYYWRIFPSQSIRRSIQTLTIICGLWALGVLIANLIECDPISRFWNLDGEGFCRWPVTLYYAVAAGPNMVIDLVIVVLPIKDVWRLKLSFWKRIGVCAIFFVGGIVVVASIVRLALLIVFHTKGTANLTEDLLLPWFSTSVEIGVAIIGASMPCLMPLYRMLRYGYPDGRPPYRNRSFDKLELKTFNNSDNTQGGQNSQGDPSKSDERGPFERLSQTNEGQEENFSSTRLDNNNARASGGILKEEDIEPEDNSAVPENSFRHTEMMKTIVIEGRKE